MKVYILLLFGLCHICASAQILNGGFEDWETIDTYEKPVGWSFNHYPQLSRVSRDTLSIEGEFSLKINSNFGSAWSLCHNELYTIATLACPSGSNQSLYFHVKAVPVNSGGVPYVRVYGKFCKGHDCSDYAWQNTGNIDEFTQIEIPLPGPLVDSLWIVFEAGAYYGATDVCFFPSTTWFDGFAIRARSLSNTNQMIYPNPSDGHITLGEDASGFTHYRVYDILGRELESGVIDASTMQLRNKGVMLLRLEGECSSVQKVITKIIVH